MVRKLAFLGVVLACRLVAAGDGVPAYVAASVHVGGCSGTVIARRGQDAWIVSAAHCFEDGAAVRFATGDGLRTGYGLVVLQDADADLSLIRCRAGDVTGVAEVPEKRPAGEFVSIGYPKGKGPETVRVRFRG